MSEERSEKIKWGGIVVFLIGLIIFILKLIECLYQVEGLNLPDIAYYVGLVLTVIGFYLAFIASYKK